MPDRSTPPTRTHPELRSRLLILVIMSLTASGVGWLSARRAVARDRLDSFARDAAWIRGSMSTRLESAAAALRAARGFIEAHPSASRADWRHFAERTAVTQNCPGASGLAFVRAIDDAELENFLFGTRQDGAPGFDVRTVGEPAAGETFHALVQFDSARDAQQKTLGLDLWTGPWQRRALELASETGSLVMTGPLDPDGAIALCLPAFERGVSREPRGQAREELLGWVVCRIDPATLASSLLVGDRWAGRGLKIADANAGIVFARPPVDDAHGPTERTFSIGFGARQWDATVGDTRLLAGIGTEPLPLIAACGGLLLATAPFGLIFWSRRIRSRAQASFEKTTERLRESERSARSALDGLGVRVAVLDAQGAVLAANLPWRETVAADRPVPGVVAERKNYVAMCDSFVGPSSIDVAHCANAVRDAVAGEPDAPANEVEIRDESGRPVYAVRVRRCPDEPDLIVISHRDIDERRIAAPAEPDDAARFASAALASGDGYWEWDLASGGVWFSGRCCEMLGRAPGTFDAGIHAWTDAIHPDDTGHVMERLRAHLTERSEYDVEFRARHASGAWVLIRARGCAQWADARPTRMAGSFTEIAAREHAEPEQGRTIHLSGTVAEDAGGRDGAAPQVEADATAEPAPPVRLVHDENPGGSRQAEQPEDEPSAHEARDEPEPADTVEPIVLEEAAGSRVLVAEDGPGNRKLIAFHLRKAGFEVELADSGQAALDLINAAETEGRPFGLVFMDMRLPDIDGYAATRSIRERGSRVPVIGLTIHGQAADRQRCLDAGCDDIVAKPIKRPPLLEAVSRWMGHAHVERRAA